MTGGPSAHRFLLGMTMFARVRRNSTLFALANFVVAALCVGWPGTIARDVAYVRGVAETITEPAVQSHLVHHWSNTLSSDLRRSYRIPDLSTTPADFWFTSRFGGTRYYHYVATGNRVFLLTSPTPTPPRSAVGTFFPASRRTIALAQQNLPPLTAGVEFVPVEFRTSEDRRWLWAALLTLRVSTAVKFLLRGIKRTRLAINPTRHLTDDNRRELVSSRELLETLPPNGTRFAGGRLCHNGRDVLLSADSKELMWVRLEQGKRGPVLVVHVDTPKRLELPVASVDQGSHILTDIAAANPLTVLGPHPAMDQLWTDRPNALAQAFTFLRDFEGTHTGNDVISLAWSRNHQPVEPRPKKRRKRHATHWAIPVLLAINVGLFVAKTTPAYESEVPDSVGVSSLSSALSGQ